MRCTQVRGLSDGAVKWLKEHCLMETRRYRVEVLREGVWVQEGEAEILENLKSESTGHTCPGMFDEDAYELTRHFTKDGRKVVEYLQACPWSSGPVLFIALRYEDTNEPIQESLWSEEDIDNA